MPTLGQREPSRWNCFPATAAGPCASARRRNGWPRRQEEEREKAERARRHEERLEQQREERVQIAMKDYASYSEKRLRKIADGETWSNHCEEEREAARRLLEHRTPQHKKNDVPWEK